MNNRQNGTSPVRCVIQPVTIDTMLNNNDPFFFKDSQLDNSIFGVKGRPPNWINFCQEFEVMKFVQQIIIRKLLTDKLKSKNYIVSMTFHHQLQISTLLQAII